MIWLIGIPLALLAALFAVSNRADVALQMWPFAGTLDLPLALAMLGMAALGFLLGALVVGSSDLRFRTRLAAEKRRNDLLQAEIGLAQDRIARFEREAERAASREAARTTQVTATGAPVLPALTR